MAILAKGAEIIETRRALPGAPDDDQSRYLEAAVSGLLIGCLYLPNGNPQPGRKTPRARVGAARFQCGAGMRSLPGGA